MTADRRTAELASIPPIQWPPLLRQRLAEIEKKNPPVIGDALFRELMVYAQCVDHLFCASDHYRATAEDYLWYEAHTRTKR